MSDRTSLPMRRSGQQWAMDQLFRLAGHDLLFPGALAFRLERGYRYAEVERTMERTKTFRQNARQWAHTADQLREMAEEAEAKGHRVTAHDFYYRASLYYGRGQWSILRDTSEKRRLYDLCVACYEKLIALGDGNVERVVLDVDGESVYGVLHLPPARKGKVPCVIFFPGMDMFKEEFPNVENNAFTRRGMAMLSLDGPGQGEIAGQGLRGHRREVSARRQSGTGLPVDPAGNRCRPARGLGCELRLLLGAAIGGARFPRQGLCRYHGRSLFDGPAVRAGAAELQG